MSEEGERTEEVPTPEEPSESPPTDLVADKIPETETLNTEFETPQETKEEEMEPKSEVDAEQTSSVPETNDKQSDSPDDAEKDNLAPRHEPDNSEESAKPVSDPVAVEKPSTTPNTSSNPEAPSLGAKILMNRFNSLKERANQNAQTLWTKGSPALSTNAKAMQETAQTLWKQAPIKIQVPAFRAGFKTMTTPPPPATKTGTPVDAAIAAPEATDAASGPPVPSNTPATVPPKDSPSMEAPSEQNEIKPNQFSLSGDAESAMSDTTSLVNATGDISDTDDDTDRESSVAAASDVAARLRVSMALSKASVAASVAYESVLASGFRGRYNANTNTDSAETKDGEGTNQDDNTITDTRPMPESQTELILKSRVGQRMQEILDKLEPFEYAMLLGKGMLGVNLKQCYLKNHGVYIDFTVPGGQADTSGVVRSGDLPVRLGDVDIRKATIYELPQQIANARRPVILIFATGTKASLERINYVDVAVAMMHRARDYYNKRGTLSNLPSASSPTNANTPNNEVQKSSVAPLGIKSVSDTVVPSSDAIEYYLTPHAPTLDMRREIHDEVPLRCFDKFIVEGLIQVHDMDKNFREAVKHAFLTCALDSRRLPFLSRHFSNEGDLPGTNNRVDDKMTPSARLMLFLELSSFLDLYHLTPITRLRDLAARITYKFFLPTQMGHKLQPPLFDFHHIVADASLRHLELVLSAKSRTIPRDVFFDFSKAVVDSLAGPFISFLASAECARMRAYLRDTAPFVNLPLRELLDGLTGETIHPGAKNCFAYMLLFLICQLEKAPSGEHDFTKEEDNGRILGASNDMCCAIFVKRTLIPTLTAAKSKIEKLEVGQELETIDVEHLVQACETFWEVHMSGTMDTTFKSNDIGAGYNAVRVELEKIASVLRKDGKNIEFTRATAEILVNSKLVDLANSLADELYFNYAANVHTKFREHKFHEWMCTEMCKLRAKDPNWNSTLGIPNLPPGCVKRLLRKAELPEGVSSHKPFKPSTTQESQSDSNYQNAEYAVVFGSVVGNDLASQMPVPGIESTDIRRYTCLPVVLDTEQNFDSFVAEDVIPPTFESYAFASPEKQRPFPNSTQNSKFSVDGWEFSLVSFTIPNAESSGSDSALYGVSLFMQCRSDKAVVPQHRIKEFIQEQEKEAGHEPQKDFQSPIRTNKEESAGQEGAESISTKSVAVSMTMTNFNAKLKESSWVGRVLADEYREPTNPVSIGLALVSRKNVILAMRDTLSRLLLDYSQTVNNGNKNLEIHCGVLADVLGNFANPDVEGASLRCILEPYMRAASSPWVDKPLSSQADAFERLSLRQLTDCLPPIPLALLFIAALLEQKIILSSSRRSVLHSTTVALGALLHPLKWSHLQVPMVPGSLAGDLIQYPAPFILGVPSEEAENSTLIGNLPRDVSLVDLDVGRVILAPEFGYDNEMVRKSEDPEATARALRTQVLYLAQALGTVFGNSLKPESWLCDVVATPSFENSSPDVERLKSSAREFVTELLEGVSSCCYWIEEAALAYGMSSEPTVLFDEDKFFAIKNNRAMKGHKPLFHSSTPGELALSLGNFDLVLESFLRCQSMSTYISSRPKTTMVYY